MQRPNILWYCTDQQRFDTIGALGNPYVRTPTLDRLAREGVAFTHAYCQSPICTPSRSSFMTGVYPGKVRNTRNGNESFPSFPPVITRLLANAGYECGLVGKFHLQSAGHRTEPRLDDGYTYWKFSHAPRDDWREGHDYADWVRARGGDLDALRASEDHVPPELHQTTWASERAIEFIKRERGSVPWLLSVNVYDPHPPFIPPRCYLERFDPGAMPGPHFRESDLAHQARLATVEFQGEVRRPQDRDIESIQAAYYAMIALIDDQLARILTALEATGQRERTVIIFTSDHGEALGDHGLLEKGCRFYEGLVRVPLIFSGPTVQRDLRSSALVELIDKTATILDLARVEIPDHVQGRSLLPILRGESPPDSHRAFVRCEYYDALDPVFTGAGQEAGADATPVSGTFATMYRDRRYKLSLYHTQGLGEMYDLENDPFEFDDLFDRPEHRDLQRELVRASFDAHVLATIDVGSRRIAPI